ncbi:hypothetical protein COCOR_01480 [Corallococcus coralloides DSM 2259]|uniref:Outer membrane protein beta-barrel domain-containing protein n=1 Tax=Corallococcus coralloides (strain ATCC 25202 / DSM 2259 / NBRC 100086 / M2) TaxID=1144275 RepID=H8MVD0_CORCM|nr:hypothetical protein [Corallococcus coralloides]AFE04092.1 hypothetical protein COCOR_01480 [Corallococcus coralloides DSM 2259]
MKPARAVTTVSLVAALAVSTLAHAEAPVSSGPPGSVRNGPSYGHRLDVGGSFGVNNAGGQGLFSGFSLMADLRPVDFLSLGAGVGRGLWGVRFTAHSRVYPLGVSRGFFLQGALAHNLGRTTWLGEEDGVDVSVIRSAVTTANASLGYRKDLGRRGWLAFEAGWAYRLDPASYRTGGERELTDSEERNLRFARPGGVILGIAGGFSVL